MPRLWISLLCGLLILVGCGTPAAAPPVVTARQIAAPTPEPAIGATSTPDMGVIRSPIDNMPIMGHAVAAPRLVDGVLRSPIDNMPIILGDTRTAPMPNGAQPMRVGPTPTP